MKVIINLVILAMIGAGGYYFYQQNKQELNETLDSVKSASVESVTEAVVEKVKKIDPALLLELAAENKDKLLELMQDNDISFENIDINQFKEKLEENGISLEQVDLDDENIKSQLKEILETIKK